MKITAKQGSVLLELAKQAISSVFSESNIDLPAELQSLLSEKRGVFVTITKRGELRGCIGFIEPIFGLGTAIVRAARSAAFSDPRFPALEKDELDAVKVEVTVLTVPREIRVKNREDIIKQIKIGEDGLIADRGGSSGLLLPQVAPEWGWDAREFLEHTCQKAGLSPDAWLDAETKIYKFQGQIFKEN